MRMCMCVRHVHVHVHVTGHQKHQHQTSSSSSSTSTSSQLTWGLKPSFPKMTLRIRTFLSSKQASNAETCAIS